MIFSRRRDATGRRGDGAGDGPDQPAAESRSIGRPAAPAGPPELGPYDVTRAPEDGLARLDLGALRVPAVRGVEIQLQADPEGQVRQVLLVQESSRLQVGVYAAPRTEGIWDEVRAEMITALAAQGGKPVEISGEYGPEVRAQVRSSGGVLDVRHVGIDGPRWFVHGIYLGAAAIDPDLAGPLREVLHGLVVDRGPEARPVREALPLRLPPEAAARLADVAGPGAGGPDGARSRGEVS